MNRCHYYCFNCDKYFVFGQETETCPDCGNELSETETIEDVMHDMFGEDGPDDGFNLDDYE